MILDKYVKLLVTEKNLSRAKKYSDNPNIGDILILPINILFFSEKVLINVKCDKCGAEHSITFLCYNKNVRKNGIYSCKNCKTEQYIKTCLEKYGVENVSGLKETIEKRKETSMKNWGCDNHMKNKDFLDNWKKNNLEKYGFETPFNSKEILNKCKEKSKEIYHTDNVFQSEIIKDKAKKTKKEKYGDENYTNRQKFILTMLERYGVDNPSKYSEFKNKVKETKLKHGYMFDESDWKIYKNKVRNITSKYKKELMENWDGFDYYDDEYIFNYQNLPNSDRKYPTIDHKISIFEGYKYSIDPEIIGNINNLCVTKRSVNSTKNSKSEKDF